MLNRTITIDKIASSSENAAEDLGADGEDGRLRGESKVIQIQAFYRWEDTIAERRNSDGPSQDAFKPLARIDYSTFLPMNSKFHMEGVPEKANELFKRGRFFDGSWYGSDRIFTGPDGKEYTWALGLNKPSLFLNDASKTPIAKFHRQHAGSKDKEPVQASLEIYEEGLHMVDLIVVTFVYIEKMRKDRERGSKR
ncbi:hypothetical protein MD484_g6646, partial [Candolleomyces efflorescens]